MFDLTLTFDNGPEPDTTPGVLDTLVRRNVHSTFFVVGGKLAMPGRRSLVERAKAEGHVIGNHTWTHSGPLGGRPQPGVAMAEISRTQDELGPLSDAHRYFRPQGGGGKVGSHLLSGEAADVLQAGRYTCVLWNAIPRDWDDADGWVDRALAQCRARPWTLMVLHDVPSGAMRHLERFLGSIEEAGGRFRQDFPPECVPIVDGTATPALIQYVSREE